MDDVDGLKQVVVPLGDLKQSEQNLLNALNCFGLVLCPLAMSCNLHCRDVRMFVISYLYVSTTTTTTTTTTNTTTTTTTNTTTTTTTATTAATAATAATTTTTATTAATAATTAATAATAATTTAPCCCCCCCSFSLYCSCFLFSLVVAVTLVTLVLHILHQNSPFFNCSCSERCLLRLRRSRLSFAIGLVAYAIFLLATGYGESTSRHQHNT